MSLCQCPLIFKVLQQMLYLFPKCYQERVWKMRKHPICCVILLIIVSAVACYSVSFAEIEETSLSAFVGTCVEIKCKVTGDVPDEDALWFWMKDGTWDRSINVYRGTIVYSNKHTERPISPQFEGRVNYTGSTRLAHRASRYSTNPSCSVSICDLTEQDSGKYFFRYIPKNPKNKWKTYYDAYLTVQENPCPIIFNKPEPVQQYEDITITCQRMYPSSCPYVDINSVHPTTMTASSYYWKTATLTFSASWEDDGREFTCEARGNKDPQLIKKITISVQYAPVVEVRVSPPQPQYKQGQSVTLSCEVTRSSPPPHRYSWYKNEQILSQRQTYVQTLQPEDSGSYTCSAENTVASAQSGPLQIDVQYTPRNTKIETVSQITEVAVGNSVTFKCNSDANPPPHTYHWYTVRPMKYLQRTDENSLELKSVQRADEGCYSCSVTNTVGPGGSSTDLCIRVLFPPTSLTLSMDTEVTEGQSVSITCRVDSSPVSTLTLSRTSQGSTEQLLKDDKNNSLSFSVNVSSAHSGEYTCSAHNRVGSDSTKRVLTVKYGPQDVTVQADPGLMVKENTTLTLHCGAQSHPPVSSVTWSRGPTGQGPPVHTGLTFSVKSVSVNDSGLYSCTAHNQVGQATSPAAEVKVTFGPKQAVVLRAEEVQGPDGSRSVTLSCSSHSFPPVSLYTWYRRTEDRVVKVSENINYTVLSTQPGVYYCTAKNDISESKSEPLSLFQKRVFVKFIFLALVPLVIILCAFLLYRLKIKRSVEEERANKSWWRSCSRAVGQRHSSRVCTETPRRPDDPGAQQRADMMNGTSSANALYSTVVFPKDKQSRPGTSDQNTQPDSLFYASLHFVKNKQTVPPKEREDVVYSTVKKHDEEAGDVYENITEVQRVNCSNVSDSSEDEADVSYSTVNFRSKARNREETRVTAAEEEYSELQL